MVCILWKFIWRGFEALALWRKYAITLADKSPTIMKNWTIRSSKTGKMSEIGFLQRLNPRPLFVGPQGPPSSIYAISMIFVYIVSAFYYVETLLIMDALVLHCQLGILCFFNRFLTILLSIYWNIFNAISGYIYAKLFIFIHHCQTNYSGFDKNIS